MSAISGQFGPQVSPWTVEQAVLATLQQPPPGGSAPRIVYYIAEQERQLGLAPHTIPIPPGPSSYQGGIDAGTLQAEWFPMIHVTVKPNGEPTPLDTYTYGQEFQIEVVSTAGDDSEDTARMVANSYGIASASAIWNAGTLGIGASSTAITRMPDPALLDPVNARQVVRSTVTFTTLIAPVLTKGGPTEWFFDPYLSPGEWPAVTTVNVTVNAVPPGDVPSS